MILIEEDRCFECDKPATEDHHVIPQSLGGIKTVPLCGSCHDRVHGWGNTRRDFHRQLTIEGLERAKARGVKLGGGGDRKLAAEKAKITNAETTKKYAESKIIYLLYLKSKNMNLRQICETLNHLKVETRNGKKWYPTTVANIFTRLDIPQYHDTTKYSEMLQTKMKNLSSGQYKIFLDFMEQSDYYHTKPLALKGDV